MKSRIKKNIFLFFFLFLAVNILTVPAQDGGELAPETVQNAIEGGITYLRKNQRDGAWEEYPGYDPGTTSLCLLALLSADLPPDDKTVAAGLEYISQFGPEDQKQTYPIALQTMVFCQADPVKYKKQIEANAAWLIEHQFKTDNQYNGGWSYTGLDQSYSIADNSNSQFAVLALYESQRAGVPVPDSVWDAVEGYWTRLQNPDGSWGYRADPRSDARAEENKNKKKSGNGTGSMTCAGITALFVSSSARTNGALVSGEQIKCCTDGETDENRKRIERGLEWLAKNFSVKKNPGTADNATSYIYYYLYGLERTGRLTAQRYIGGSDWYREGVDSLLRRKGTISQFWKPGGSAEQLNSVATAFAILFLSKGRWPVLVSKLKYTTNEEAAQNEWNFHPDDLDHLTRYTERCWNRKLIWQVIDAGKAEAEDYAQTPVLSISGRYSPLPADPAERKTLAENLRAYLDQGGFILAEGLDGDVSFDSGFRTLVQEIFPEEEEGGLAVLPEDHPIWRMERDIPPEYLRPLYGVDLGCRTSLVYIPAPQSGTETPSLSCLWELADEIHHGPPYAVNVQKQIDAGLDIGVNILAYAAERELKYKDEIQKQAEERNVQQKSRSIYAGILDIGNGSPCAPRAIPNLMTRIQSNLNIPVRTDVQKVRINSRDLGAYPILFLHGRNAFTLSDKDAEILRNYFDWGGFLFANAICASKPFTQSFAAELKKVFPNDKLEPIPADDPLFSDLYGGSKISKLEIRKLAVENGEKKGLKITEEPPRLYGIKRENRWVVVFSPYDISCALEGHSSTRCAGFTSESAWRLAVNVVLYAAEHL